jgi:aryl-alcohol dehydrogenase-like predicted oxidoreductase
MINARYLGNSGLKVSAIGLGCNSLGGRVDEATSRQIVHKALDVGITLFDTANSYGDRYGQRGGSETCLGKFLGPRRKQIVLASKFGNPTKKSAVSEPEGASRRSIMLAVEASLTRLNTDWIDLYQIHHPDSHTPIEETLRALDDLVRQGKVRYIGCSNFAAWQAVEAQCTAKQYGLNPLASCQNEYNLLERDAKKELIPAMQSHGMGLLPYYPLAGGVLTGKYQRGTAPAAGTRFAATPRLADRYWSTHNWSVIESLEKFCAARGKGLLDIAFGWLLAQPVVASVIAGATSAEQLERNVAASTWQLGDDNMKAIAELLSPEAATT